MGITKIDGVALRKMMIAASNELSMNKNALDALNVFPVPDGDTGTNMSLTVQAAAREVFKQQTPNASDIAIAASSGALRGARGNSGVILSQLFRGFAKGLEGKALVEGADLARALRQASETAYVAVMKPKEGTILTVAAAVAEAAEQFAPEINDIELLLQKVIKRGHDMLARTTDMLPVLKEAGVVDAGGKGLMHMLEGAFKSLKIDGEITLDDLPQQGAGVMSAAAAAAGGENIEFGYCTEFFINSDKPPAQVEARLKTFLQTVGDSVVVVGDEGLFKIHVHTENPGKVLEFALKIGSLDNIKIENMRLQHSSLIRFTDGSSSSTSVSSTPVPSTSVPSTSVPSTPVPSTPVPSTAVSKTESPPAEYGFVAVAAGEGLIAFFEALGANEVIKGGQTMNPSIDDILQAVQKTNAKNVFILPNNKNIILAAEQAANLAEGQHSVRVLPTKSIPQGITAMIAHLPNAEAEATFLGMQKAITTVKTGQITRALRTTTLNGIDITEGDVLCLLEGENIFVEKDLQTGAKRLLDAMLESGGDLVGIYYGEGVSADDAADLSTHIEENHPNAEVECVHGGQPIYHYIFSVE